MMDIFNRQAPMFAPQQGQPQGMSQGQLAPGGGGPPRLAMPQGPDGGLVGSLPPPPSWPTLGGGGGMGGGGMGGVGMPAKPPGMDLETYMAVCGPGMQGPAGGNGRVGFRAANGDTGVQGANMPQAPRSSWLDGLSGSGPMPQGGGGMFGGGPFNGVMSEGPKNNNAMPLPQMPGAPTQMPAFQPPQPMPFMPQQPMPGMQPYNFSQQGGQTAPPSPMTGQMKGMFGVR